MRERNALPNPRDWRETRRHVGSTDEGLPLWRRIEQSLLADIATGLLASGAQIPSESQLASRFSAHRHTARRAIASLVQRGVVRIERGRGTFVHRDAIDYIIGRRTRLEENLLRQNRSHRGRMLWTTVLPADEVVAAALEIAEGTPVNAAELINEADDVPISLTRQFLPVARFTGFVEAYRESAGSVAQALARCGVPDFERRWTKISARLPSTDDAKLLRQPPSLPILHVQSVEADLQGTPIKFAFARYAGERINLVVGAPERPGAEIPRPPARRSREP